MPTCRKAEVHPKMHMEIKGPRKAITIFKMKDKVQDLFTSKFKNLEQVYAVIKTVRYW